MTTPREYGDQLDYLMLGTMRSPGLVKLSEHDRVKDWDVKKAKGQTGASSSLNGEPIGEFNAEFTLTTPEDFERWDVFQRLLETLTNGPKPIALPILHPDLQRNHYNDVSGARIGGRTYDGLGGATHKVRFIEYRPPKPKPPAKAKAKPGGALAGTTPSKPDPNAAAKAQLAALLAEAKKP